MTTLRDGEGEHGVKTCVLGRVAGARVGERRGLAYSLGPCDWVSIWVVVFPTPPLLPPSPGPA